MAGKPQPIELKKAKGRTSKTDSGGRPLSKFAVITQLPQTLDIPEPPASLGVDGVRFWERAWGAAITWISKDVDREAIENAAKLADASAAAFKKYMATLEGADARALVSINDAYTKSLSALGFDPTSRSRLGVAEIRIVSKLEQLAHSRNSGAK